MKASWAATEGQKTQLAILYVSVFFVLAGVGLFACLVWSVVPFVAPALWALITAIVYTRLIGQSGAQQVYPDYPPPPLCRRNRAYRKNHLRRQNHPPNGPWNPDWLDLTAVAVQTWLTTDRRSNHSRTLISWNPLQTSFRKATASLLGSPMVRWNRATRGHSSRIPCSLQMAN
ncbi:hypothetical protein [Pendulispora albinea]|uniref:Uncharacterized protein n=1 Tax=Pendulispora albinea TaxID=2741071 RepID=A0ABZ2LJM6_9BACT